MRQSYIRTQTYLQSLTTFIDETIYRARHWLMKRFYFCFFFSQFLFDLAIKILKFKGVFELKQLQKTCSNRQFVKQFCLMSHPFFFFHWNFEWFEHSFVDCMYIIEYSEECFPIYYRMHLLGCYLCSICFAFCPHPNNNLLNGLNTSYSIKCAQLMNKSQIFFINNTDPFTFENYLSVDYSALYHIVSLWVFKT